MPRLDSCHNQIVRALEKANWQVGIGPYVLPVPDRRPLQIDIYAYSGDNRNETIIIVEAKCFADEGAELNELYTAIGQYLVYRHLLRKMGRTENLYLAVPTHAFQNIIRPLAMPLSSEIQLKMMVVNIEQEVIEQWLD